MWFTKHFLRSESKVRELQAIITSGERRRARRAKSGQDRDLSVNGIFSQATSDQITK